MEQVQLTFFLPRLLSTPEQKLKYVAVSVTLSTTPQEKWNKN